MFSIHKRAQLIAFLLIVTSILLYALDYFLFGQAREIGFGLIGNLAFLPIYVLLVTLMIERVLKERDKEALRQKMNMVIGVFFSEAGTILLRDGYAFLVEQEQLSARVRVTAAWGEAEFRGLAAFLDGADLHLDSRRGDLEELKGFLVSKRAFLLGLLENPNLLEHDGFTDLLWAIFHLLEELQARLDFSKLPQTDMDHLSVDIGRAYTRLLAEWIVYLRHLKNDYPYLFSLAIRNNPLNPDARIEVT